MRFLANTSQPNFGRTLDERRQSDRHDGEVRQALRRAQRRPAAVYIVQRYETLLAELLEINDGSGFVILYLRGFVRHMELRCYFANSSFRGVKSSVGVTDLYQMCKEAGYPSVILFLVVDPSDIAGLMEPLDAPMGLMLCLVQFRWMTLFALVAAEVASWEGCHGIFEGIPTHHQVSTAASALIAAIANVVADQGAIPDVLSVNKIGAEVPAWRLGADKPDIGVDEGKLLTGRTEQVLDELNRLAQTSIETETSAEANLIYFSLQESVRSLYPAFVGGLSLFRNGGIPAAGSVVQQRTAKASSYPEYRQLMLLRNEFIPISEGSFLMGKNESTALSEPSAEPEHFVELAKFWIMKTPFTEWHWRLCIDDSYSGGSSKPITRVSLLQAMGCADHLTDLFHRHELIDSEERVAVPSEAQWEKGARGVDGRDYPWGQEFSLERCNVLPSKIGDISAVEMFSPIGASPYGLLDMSGNVREWTRGYAGASIRSHVLYPYDSKNELNLRTLDMTMQIIIRGGSYSYDPDCVKCWVRNKEIASQRRADTGFRLVIERS